jgi:hypothetical protein
MARGGQRRENVEPILLSWRHLNLFFRDWYKRYIGHHD